MNRGSFLAKLPSVSSGVLSEKHLNVPFRATGRMWEGKNSPFLFLAAIFVFGGGASIDLSCGGRRRIELRASEGSRWQIRGG